MEWFLDDPEGGIYEWPLLPVWLIEGYHTPLFAYLWIDPL